MSCVVHCSVLSVVDEEVSGILEGKVASGRNECNGSMFDHVWTNTLIDGTVISYRHQTALVLASAREALLVSYSSPQGSLRGCGIIMIGGACLHAMHLIDLPPSRARYEDARFFYDSDRSQQLQSFRQKLEGIVFQVKGRGGRGEN